MSQGNAGAVQAYVLVQTEVGKAVAVATAMLEIAGVVRAEPVAGPYDVIVTAEGNTLDDLLRLVVSRVQLIDGITRTQTCPVMSMS